MVYRLLYSILGKEWAHVHAPFLPLQVMSLIFQRPTRMDFFSVVDKLSCDHYYVIDEDADFWRVFLVFTHDEDAMLFRIANAELLKERSNFIDFIDFEWASFEEVDERYHLADPEG